MVSVVAQGQQVLVLSQEGDWYRVSCNGVTGFVHGDYMEVTGQGTADLGYGLVKCSAGRSVLLPVQTAIRLIAWEKRKS